MIAATQKQLRDPTAFVAAVQATNPELRADFILSAWLPSLKSSALDSAPAEEAFTSLLYIWLRMLKEHAIDPENKEQPAMFWLSKLFGTTTFSDLRIVKMEKDYVRLLTNHLVRDYDDEKKRILEINSLKKVEGVQIHCKTGNILVFGRTAMFYFLVADSYLTAQGTPSNIEELLFLNDMPMRIRKRPGMFTGSLSKSGLYNLFYSLVEELLEASAGNNIQIRISPANVIEFSSETYSLENHLPPVSYISVASALSEFFIWQDEALKIRTEQGLLVKRTEQASRGKGITITWKPDSSVFQCDTALDYYVLLNRMMELASINPYEIHLSNQENQNIIRIPNGITSLLRQDSFHPYTPIPISISFDGFTGYAAIMFSSTPLTRRSYVNNRLTTDGGTHADGLLLGAEKALTKILNDYSNPLPRLPNDTEDQKTMREVFDNMAAALSCDRIMDNLNYVIHMKVKDPRFSGSSRNALKNIEVKPIVAKQVQVQLYSYLAEDITPLRLLYPWVFDAKRKR